MLVQDASFAKLPKAAPYEFESRLESMPPLSPRQTLENPHLVA